MDISKQKIIVEYNFNINKKKKGDKKSIYTSLPTCGGARQCNNKCYALLIKFHCYKKH